MASVYRKRGRWWLRIRGADGRWHDSPAKGTTKPAARLEALERERVARQQRDGLLPSDDNLRRTFGELMNLWQERYGSRLRSQTMQLSVEKHLRPTLGKLRLGGAAAALPAVLNSKIGELSPSTLNHLRAYCHRLYAVASMRSVGWWMGPNPVNRLELPRFKEPKRKRPTVSAEDVPRVLAALSPEWRPLFATAFFLGLRRGELLALQKEDIDPRDWTITVRRSHDADVTKGGDDGTVPIPEPLRPYIDAAIKLSPSKWVFPAADGKQRAPDTNLKAVLRRALGRAGIVDAYEHRCRKPGCGHVELASDDGNRRCPKDNRALWIRPLPKKGIVFHSLRHTTATLLARAKVHPSIAQKILRHADIATTLAIYTHLDGIEDMRAAIAKLDFGPLAERAPAPVVPLKKEGTFAANLLPAAASPKAEAPDRAGNASKIRGLQKSGRLDLNQRPLAPQASALPGCATPRYGCCGGQRRNTRSCGRQSENRDSALLVQGVLQHLRRPERQHAAGGNLDLLARLRVAADARFLLAHDEVAEPRELDLLSALQRVLHRVEHHLHDLGGFLLGEPDFAAHAVDDVCLGHRPGRVHGQRQLGQTPKEKALGWPHDAVR